jgi:NAD-dependent SIR2 family protein deacetylase
MFTNSGDPNRYRCETKDCKYYHWTTWFPQALNDIPVCQECDKECVLEKGN